MGTVLAVIAAVFLVSLVVAMLFGAITWFGSGETPDEGAIPFDELQEREYGA